MNNEESWVDITTCFKEGAATLAEGELYMDDKFSLVEAMTAIEIMDPKMDSTAALFSLGREILSFDSGIRSGVVKVDNFTLDELVGIMDETIATLITWIDGQNILQTVFTCLYLHDYHKIKDESLKTFVILILKFINWVITHTNSSRVCYEEDFVTVHQLTFQLANDIPDSEALAYAKDIENSLQGKISEDSNWKLVINRLACFRLLLQCLLACGNYTSISQYERDAEWLNKAFSSLKQILKSIESTVNFGIVPAKDANSESTSATATRFDYPTIMGFDPLANQHLLPPTLPRAPFIKSRKESVQFLVKLVEDSQLLFTQPDLRYEPWEFLDFLVSFTARAPNVLVRMIGRDLLTNVINDAGENPSLNSSKQETNEAAGILPNMCRVFLNINEFNPKVLEKMSAEARASCQTFLTNLTCTLISYIQLHYLNLSRQRDKIGKLLDQMSVITDHAENVDSVLSSLPNPSPSAEKPRLELLTTFLTTSMQMRYVLLGFQLGIYAPHEYRYVFAGLAEHFLRYYVAFIENAHNIVLLSVQPPKSAKSKSKAKHVEPPPAAYHLEEMMRLAQTYYSLCMAYFFLSHGLILDGRIATPKASKYDDEGRRYFYRFSPFASVTRPPYFSYEMYHRVFEQIFRDCSYPAKCYQQAFIFFNHARRGLENLNGAPLKWQTLFAIPTPLPRPANPIMPIALTIKRVQIVLNILMSELPIASQLSLVEPPSSCHDSCCSSHHCAPEPAFPKPAAPLKKPTIESAETLKGAAEAASKPRTKIQFVFSGNSEFPSLEVVKNDK